MIQKAITVSEKLSLSVKMAVKNLEIFDCNLSLISSPKNIFFLVKNVSFDPPLTQFISHFVSSHTIHNPIFSVTLFLSSPSACLTSGASKNRFWPAEMEVIFLVIFLTGELCYFGTF